jgi:ribosome-binding factor A
MSESQRQLKFAKLIKKDISEILHREYTGMFAGSLVSVSDVSMSPDLGLARIYLSIFPVNKTESVMELLNAEKSKLRGALGKRIGKQVRIVPELALFNDNTAEEASHMDRLIDSLVIPPESTEDQEDTDER